MNNSKQNLLQSALLALFAASGPVAKYLAGKYQLDDVTIDFVLQAGTIFTPLAAGAVYYAMNTITSKIAAIKAASPEVQAEVVRQLPSAAVAVGVSNKTDANQTIVAQAMSVEAMSGATSTMSTADQATIATSMEPVAVVSAVTQLPDVSKVLVNPDAHDGVRKLATNQLVSKVDFDQNK